MKKLVVFLLALSLVGVAFAQHRGGRGGYNNGGQHSGYSGYQHGGQRHHGGYGWVAPLFIGAGVTYLATRPYYVEPQVVYYEPLPPRVIPAPQQQNNCHREMRKIFDEKGAPLGEQILLVCPIVTQ